MTGKKNKHKSPSVSRTSLLDQVAAGTTDPVAPMRPSQIGPSYKNTPLGYPTWATGYYTNHRGETLPNGVVWVPYDSAAPGALGTSVWDKAAKLGGHYMGSTPGGFYMKADPYSPFWQTPAGRAALAEQDPSTTASVAPRAAADRDAKQQAALAAFDQANRQPQETLNGAGTPASNPDPLGRAKGAGKAAITNSNPLGLKIDDKGHVVTAGGQNVTDTFSGQQYQAGVTAQATFAALALPLSFKPNDTFLFSQGAGGITPQGTQLVRDPKSGKWIIQPFVDQRQDLAEGPRGQNQNQPFNSPQQQNTAQYMTVADALQTFVRMSVTDKQAYNQLVVALNKGGYFTAQSGNMNYLPNNQLPLGTYSRNAGIAAVEAMQDLAVAQSAGYSGDLNQWLKDRSQGYEDYVNSGAGYNPSLRSYQDPATLAATAKSAAQAAIGRNLTPAEEAAFDAQFRSKENAAYGAEDAYGRAKAEANFTGASGLPAGTPTSVTMPDTSGEADQFLNSNPQFAQERAGYQTMEMAKGLVDFLRGGGL